MNKATLFSFILCFLLFSNLTAQNIDKILVENRWSAYDNFAMVDFQENGKAIIEYAYCSYCKGNIDTLNWQLNDRLLQLGEDTLKITSASNNEIVTQQYGHQFNFKNIKKIKATKLKKEAIINHLVTDIPLSITANNPKSSNGELQDIQFKSNGKMWIENPKFRGQWAIKSFYSQYFLIYINRYSVNRDFPLLHIKSLKKGKLIAQSIPSITKGAPIVLAIE